MSETVPSEAAHVVPLTYRAAPGWAAAQPVENAAENAAASAAGGPSATAGAMPALSTEQQRKASEKLCWEEGVQEGLARREAEFSTANLQLREGIAGGLRDFAQARDAYFHTVEGEVVALALAVVRKILRREAQVDPLLLSGLVRVALEKMVACQTVRMRAHPSQIAAWHEYFAQQGDLPIMPELSGDATLEHDCCQLETELGVTDLNLDMQLKEIEKGLFDLLAQRPAPQGATPQTPAPQTPPPPAPAPQEAQNSEPR
ncbi:MAG: FliH/SctL family protein [Candidatus Acidiferrales bacterium]|jgi:flagellar assembly protein FliH